MKAPITMRQGIGGLNPKTLAPFQLALPINLVGDCRFQPFVVQAFVRGSVAARSCVNRGWAAAPTVRDTTAVPPDHMESVHISRRSCSKYLFKVPMQISPIIVRDIAPILNGETCPLYRSPAAPLPTVEGRDYWHCLLCEARFLDPRMLPTRDVEYHHYLNHENDPDDPAYRRFLSKLAEPLLARLRPASRGFDYGCGPGPALAAMLREAGHGVAPYDPFFQPDRALLSECYDFVTCAEPAEHFHRPAEEFETLMARVRPGGWLAVMTCFQTDDARFRDWHYRKDPTHVVFYRERTLRFIAQTRGWTCEIPAKDVALMRRPSRGNGMP